MCQVSQLIEYLRRPENIKVEGIFRKHGNLKKQQTLKERLNKGITVDLDSAEFTVHEVAATLKNFLSDLSEPLLTDAYYRSLFIRNRENYRRDTNLFYTCKYPKQILKYGKGSLISKDI